MNPILARVREVIGETGETQKALEKLGVATQQLLSRWATVDEAEPSSSSLAKIALGLGVNGHWLLTGQGDRRTIPAAGADAVFEAGVAAGLQRAEDAVRALRGVSPVGRDEVAELEAIVAAVKEEEVHGAAHHPQRRGAKAPRRRAAEG